MRTQTAVAMALLSMSVLAGLAAVPVQAVGPDCDKDYFITHTSQTRTLEPIESEVGQANVSALNNEELNVTLATNDDKLEFAIFEMDGQTCKRSTNVDDDCDQDVVLDTTGPLTEDWIVCTLEAGTLVDREFFVVTEEIQGGDNLQYSVGLE